MTVYFIGAGPGAADLVTVRAQRLIERCPVCLYVGSLVPAELLAACPPGAPGQYRRPRPRPDHHRAGRCGPSRRGCRTAALR